MIDHESWTVLIQTKVTGDGKSVSYEKIEGFTSAKMAYEAANTIVNSMGTDYWMSIKTAVIRIH